MANTESQNGVLIVFGSKYGQTEKVATRIADVIGSEYPVELWRAGRGTPREPLQFYRGIVMGSAVFAGRHLKVVKDFIRSNSATLRNLPTAFFSVSGSAGGKTEEEQARAQQQIDLLLTATDWSPDLRAAIGGAMSFSKYPWLLRLFVRMMMRSREVKTNGRTDIEYTDWAAVDQFARNFIALLNRRAAAA